MLTSFFFFFLLFRCVCVRLVVHLLLYQCFSFLLTGCFPHGTRMCVSVCFLRRRERRRRRRSRAACMFSELQPTRLFFSTCACEFFFPLLFVCL
ncbi:hypothetical protein TRSC58_07683 [Trypanosoma rangeli SC58]|uniref:Uncharacterized protein n=1 Tax=Trypanosoma rangeli SC58 TaxID=429131 RepID=A0A061ISE3_TRYRA|nr:hypothetical protein TRSC58_07683 [Trypanosoma rangeli SC58]